MTDCVYKLMLSRCGGIRVAEYWYQICILYVSEARHSDGGHFWL